MFSFYGVAVYCLRVVDYIYSGRDKIWIKGTNTGGLYRIKEKYLTQN